MPKLKLRGIIKSQTRITGDIYDMWIEVPELAKDAKAGQFISVYLEDGKKLLPRPISICEISEEALRIVYRANPGDTGTALMSRYKEGESIEILGNLGNGFPTDREDTILIGGGIGIPPMLELVKNLKGKTTVVLGYRDSESFLKSEFEKYTKVFAATEDGSVGTKGNVIDAIKENGLEAKCIMACGPTPMLRAVKQYAHENNIECFLSLEERMACGIGACLACVCQTIDKDSYSHVNNTRICKDGPVFRAEEIQL